MPITIDQLIQRQRENPDQFKKDQQALFQFSIKLTRWSGQLMRAPRTGSYIDQANYKIGYPVGEKIQKSYVDAFSDLHLDPSDPKNHERIEKALDTLATLEDFLGSQDERFSDTNNCKRIQLNIESDSIGSELRDGLNLFNSFCGFGLDVDSLVDGKVNHPSEAEREKKKSELTRWRQQRASEKEAREAEEERRATERRQRLAEERQRREEEDRIFNAEPIRRAPEEEEEDADDDEEIDDDVRDRLAFQERIVNNLQQRLHPEIRQENIKNEPKEEEKLPANNLIIEPEEDEKEKIDPVKELKQEEDLYGNLVAQQEAKNKAAIEAYNKQILEQRDLQEAQANARTNKIAELRTSANDQLEQARNRRAPLADRKTSLARAAANLLERDVLQRGNAFDQERVNENYQAFLKAFTVEERTGGLDALTRRDPDGVLSYAKAVKENFNAYVDSTEFGRKMNPNWENALDRNVLAREYSSNRANSIYQQMDRTWRVARNSQQFEHAKQAMQDLGNTNQPWQADHYAAGEIVKKYIAKNLNAAKSAVGMTRMSCALAFLKQTMTEQSFANYCNSLNRLRGIPERVNDDNFGFDKTEPRCIVPDEIGTVKEVYDAAKRRIGTLMENETAPSPRELAILMAVKRLQARGKDGENTVVEHEALQKEIEKIQLDRRFAAMLTRPVNERLMMAWEGNLDTIEGCGRGLNENQQARITEENEKKLAEEKARKDREEQERKDEADRKEKENQRLKEENERKAAEDKKLRERQAAFEKFREKNKTLDEVLAPLYPTLVKVAKPDAAQQALEHFNDDPYAEYTQFAANLIAINELGVAAMKLKKSPKANEFQKEKAYINLDDLNKRVDELKNDPVVGKLAKYLRDNPEAQKDIAGYKANVPKNRNEDNYVIIQLADKLKNDHNREHQIIAETIDPSKWPTVARGYSEFKKNIDNLAGDRNVDYQTAGILAAKMVALREIELRGKGGLDNKINMGAWAKRWRELHKDPLFNAIGQNLVGPNGQKNMARAFNMKPNREQAFAEHVTNMYQELKLQREQKQKAQQHKAQQNLDVQPPKEQQNPDAQKVNEQNGGGVQIKA